MRLQRVAIAIAVLLSAAPGRAEMLRVTSRWATLRADWTLSSRVVTRLRVGELLEVLERPEDWYRVRVVRTGAVGYVHRSLVQPSPEEGSQGTPLKPATPPRPSEQPADSERPAPPPRTTAPPVAVRPAPKAPSRTGAPPATTLAPPTPRETEGRPRLALMLNGLLGLHLDYADKRTFTEFAEEGTLDTKFSEKSGVGFDMGIQYGLTDRFGIRGSLSLLNRTGTAALDG